MTRQKQTRSLCFGDCFEFAMQILAMTVDINLLPLLLQGGKAVVAIAYSKITACVMSLRNEV